MCLQANQLTNMFEHTKMCLFLSDIAVERLGNWHSLPMLRNIYQIKQATAKKKPTGKYVWTHCIISKKAWAFS